MNRPWQSEIVRAYPLTCCRRASWNPAPYAVEESYQPATQPLAASVEAIAGISFPLNVRGPYFSRRQA
jgi:hypothetical protein